MDHRLEHEVDDAVGDDHGDHEPRAALEERKDGGRRETDDEADVGDVVGDEREKSPQQGQRHSDEPEEQPVEDRHDQSEHRGDHEIAACPAGEAAEGCDERGLSDPDVLEDVAIGPPEWDMATMHDEAPVLARLAPDPARLAACTLLRDLQVALCLAGLDDVFGDVDGWADGLRFCVDGVRQRVL